MNPIEALKQFLTNENLSKIAQNYQQNSQHKESVGFNAFVLASDSHYKENFHSDILQAILAPVGAHNEKSKFLHLFIDLLNKIKAGKEIDKADFQNAVVVREEARIDVLIRDEKSKKAIIIENKMNNAGDMNRQLPRYYDSICTKGFEVVTIVYLPLQAGKTPNKDNKWSEKDKENIEAILKILPAYATNTFNLYEHWLMPCLQQAQDFDAICVLRQYAKLIKSLNINSLDMESIEEFYNLLQENNGANWQNAISIYDMLNQMPFYLAEKIRAKYENKHLPFSKLDNILYENIRLVTFSGFYPKGRDLRLDIKCCEYEWDYVIRLWEHEGEYKGLHIKDEVSYTFQLSEEIKVFEIIDAILADLRKLPALPAGGKQE